jgi:hypothetical protein
MILIKNPGIKERYIHHTEILKTANTLHEKLRKYGLYSFGKTTILS